MTRRGTRQVFPGTYNFHINTELSYEALLGPSCPEPGSPRRLEWCPPLTPSSFSEDSSTKTARTIRSASSLRHKRETKPYARSSSDASILQKVDTNSQLQRSFTTLATFPSHTPSSNTSQLDGLPSVSHQIPQQSSPRYPTSDVNSPFPSGAVIDPVLQLLLEEYSEQGMNIGDIMAASGDDDDYPATQNPY